ncbi:MAG: hypothetical protein ACM3U0_01795, partial [archaeon]
HNHAKYSIGFLPEEKESLFYRGNCFYVTDRLKSELEVNLSLEFTEEGLRAHFYNMDEHIRKNPDPSRDLVTFIRRWFTREMEHSYKKSGNSHTIAQKEVYI